MKRILTLGIILVFLPGWHWFDPVARQNARGISAYKAERWGDALSAFTAARGMGKSREALHVNTALALYQLEKYPQALKEMDIPPQASWKPGADYWYNKGNILFRMEKYPEALEAYRSSLMLDGDDLECKKNFELTQKKIREQKKQQQQDDQQKPRQDKDERQKQHQGVFRYLQENDRNQQKKLNVQDGAGAPEKDW